MLTKEAIASLALWVPLSLYVSAIWMQILKNFHIKSTKGISFCLGLFFYVGVFSGTLYVYFLNLPLAFKVMIIFQAIAITTLAFQQYAYASFQQIKRRTLTLYGFATTLFVLALGLAYFYPFTVGHISGWICIVTLALSRIPQIIKIFLRKTTSGFSLGFVLLGITAELIELTSVIVLKLPIQSIIDASRRLLIDTIFLSQFYLYRKNNAESIPKSRFGLWLSKHI